MKQNVGHEKSTLEPLVRVRAVNSVATQLEGVYLSRYEVEALEAVLLEPEATKQEVDVVKGMVSEYWKLQAQMEAVFCALSALAITDERDEDVQLEEMCTQQLLEVMVV